MALFFKKHTDIFCLHFLVYYENPIHIKHRGTLCNGCFFRLEDFTLEEEEEPLEHSLPFLAYLLPFLLIAFILLIFLLHHKSICKQTTTESQENLIIVKKHTYHLCQTDHPIPV